MRKLLFVVISFLALTQLQAQNGVAISTSTTATPDASAVFDVQSTTQGMLIPRMTESQKNAISSPATGLMIYQTDGTPGFYHYDGSNWVTSSGAKSINDLSDGKVVYGGTTEYSIALGQNAGQNMTTWYNVAVGTSALQNLSNGSQDFNTAIGYEAGKAMTNGIQNVFIGYQSGYVYNPASGAGNNTMVGARSAHALTTGVENIGIGKDALFTLTTGSHNVAITNGGAGFITGDSNIVIGAYGTNLVSGSANGQMNIGNTIYGTGIYTASAKVGIGHGNTAPNSTLHVNGSLALPMSLVQSGTITVGDNDYTILTENGASVVLPDAITCPGRIYIIKATVANASSYTIVTATNGNVDGNANVVLQSNNKYIMVQADGGGGHNWWIIGNN